MSAISDKTIRAMHRDSLAGMSDANIAVKYGCQENTVLMNLARVMPDGRITKDIYGGVKPHAKLTLKRASYLRTLPITEEYRFLY